MKLILHRAGLISYQMPGNSKSQEEGVRLLKLALSIYRNPASAANLTSGTELPESMGILIRVANGEPELLPWATGVTGAAEKELKSSCIAFIERVFFVDDADPFRILGLNPWATAENIKEHYRLLIRLFHPDRGVAAHASADKYAAMINQAHSQLKKLIPERPAQYQSRSNAASSAGPVTKAKFPAQVSPSAFTAANRFSLRISLARLTPTMVLGSIAFIAVLIVAVPYLLERQATPPQHELMTSGKIALSQDVGEPQQTLNYGNLVTESRDIPAELPPAGQQPAPATTTSATDGVDQPPGITAVAAESPDSKVPSGSHVSTSEKLSREASKAEPATPTNHPPVIPRGFPAVKEGEAKQSAKLDGVDRHDSAGPARAATSGSVELAGQTLSSAGIPRNWAQTEQISLRMGTKAVEATPLAPASPTAKSEVEAGTNTQIVRAISATATSPAIAPAPLTIPTTPAVAVKSNPPSEMELHNVIAHFIGSYARGDLDGFMSIFDEKLRTDEPGGKAGLRNTYTRFFSTTQAREMVLMDLHWERNGDLVRGMANYHVTVSGSGATPRSSSGTLQFEVAKTGAGAMIVGFFHQTARK